MPRVRSLSVHATYRCGNSGACCTSNWPIVVETDRLADMRAALVSGRLRSSTTPPFVEQSDSEDGDRHSTLLSTIDHRCTFFDGDAACHCRVQHALGHQALPLACRQFPRIVVHDPRGVSVTLSHFCPTAAALLDDEGPVEITDTPPAFPMDGEYDGLDVRDALPPLLRPGLLMDWPSWWALERASVDLLGNNGHDIDRAIRTLGAAVEVLRCWRPGDGELLALVNMVTRAWPDPLPGAIDFDARRAEVFAALPEYARAWMPADAACSPLPSPRVHARFLAAHAFGNWTAHLGQGLRTWHRSIDAAHALLASGFSVRHADLVIRHLSDPGALADVWGRAEI